MLWFGWHLKTSSDSETLNWIWWLVGTWYDLKILFPNLLSLRPWMISNYWKKKKNRTHWWLTCSMWQPSMRRYFELLFPVCWAHMPDMIIRTTKWINNIWAQVASFFFLYFFLRKKPLVFEYVKTNLKDNCWKCLWKGACSFFFEIW